MEGKFFNIGISYFYYCKFHIYLAYLLIILNISKSYGELGSKMKAIYASNNKYFIITYDKIYFYDKSTQDLTTAWTFTSDQQITDEAQFEMISYGYFKDSQIGDLILVKNYIYFISESHYYCDQKINEIGNYTAQAYPFKCFDSYCGFVIVYKNGNQLEAYLYKKSITECDATRIKTYTVGTIVSTNFCCQFMYTSGMNSLACFFEGNSNELIAEFIEIQMDNINSPEINRLRQMKMSNINGNVFQSAMSVDGKKVCVCYINNNNNNCDCLYYDVSTDHFSNSYTTYINNCESELSSLIFDYYEISGEYYLYCFQPSSKFTVLKLNSDLQIINQYSNFTYNLAENCTDVFFSSLIYNESNPTFFYTCDHNLKDPSDKEKSLMIITTIPETTILTTILTTIPETTILTTIPESTIITTYYSRINNNNYYTRINNNNYYTRINNINYYTRINNNNYYSRINNINYYSRINNINYNSRIKNINYYNKNKYRNKSSCVIR